MRIDKGQPFKQIGRTQLFANPAHLVSGSAHSDHLVRLHGVHAVRHDLAAMGTGGGDDASVARDVLHLDSKRAQAQQAPHGSAQLCACSHLRG